MATPQTIGISPGTISNVPSPSDNMNILDVAFVKHTIGTGNPFFNYTCLSPLMSEVQNALNLIKKHDGGTIGAYVQGSYISPNELPSLTYKLSLI